MTPFTEDGTIAFDHLETQVNFIVEDTGATAIPLLAVEAQEYRYLSTEDRRRIIRRCAETVDGRLPVIVGISYPSVRRAIEFAEIATEVDASAVQLLIPDRRGGGDHPRAEITRYVEQIGDAIDLPIVLYHNSTVGATLDHEELRSLANLDSVVAFKESSRNARHVMYLIEHVDRAGLADYFTTMEMAITSLLLGGSGVTTPAPSAVIVSQLIEAFQAGDLSRCVSLQRAFAEFPVRWLDHGFPTVMKAALSIMGIDGGVPYPPMEPLTNDQHEELATTLRDAGLV